jgi:hypothetical protein
VAEIGGKRTPACGASSVELTVAFRVHANAARLSCFEAAALGGEVG